jgi:glycine cleavage system aminomethyltransferase T
VTTIPERIVRDFGPCTATLCNWSVELFTHTFSLCSAASLRVYTAMCNEHGGMIDDGTVFRLGQNNFRWICGDEYSPRAA